jgi:alkanesulfonate monooxygenase SsuD/methylene tetrahydromethanopterin reductase-like flavin-dependent oxidoreductase (luciferase family)
VLLPQPYNHPIRVAERIGALDILSNGRLDVGFARSTTLTEMGAFGIVPNNTRPMMDDAIHIIPQLMMTSAFPANKRRVFSPSVRIVTSCKTRTKAATSIWMACSSTSEF